MRVALSIIAAVLVAAATPAFARSPASPSYDGVPNGAFSVVAQVRAKPGKADDLRRITLPLVAQVRGEPGNLVYFLQEDRATPGHFVFYEIFATQADFEAHNATPHVQAWFAQLPELADGGVEVQRMRILGHPDR